MVDQVREGPAGSPLQIFAPMVRGKKGEHRRELEGLRKSGFTRVRINGNLKDLSEEIKLDKKKNHTIEVLIDRLVIKDGMEKRLADSLETALRIAHGTVVVAGAGEGRSAREGEHRGQDGSGRGGDLGSHPGLAG